MKYPKSQYDVLVKTVEFLWSKVSDARKLAYDALSLERQAADLHYAAFVYHNFSDPHRVDVLNRALGDNILKQGTETDMPPVAAFPLYPEGCNDDHISTAVRKCLRDLNIRHN